MAGLALFGQEKPAKFFFLGKIFYVFKKKKKRRQLKILFKSHFWHFES